MDLRRKQINDVLDYDRNINRQVFDLEKKQVRTFDEKVLPAADKDTSVGVSAESQAQSIKTNIEHKIQLLENVINIAYARNATGAFSTKFVQDLNDITNSSLFLKDYNSLMKSVQDPKLNRQTLDSIKTTIQGLDKDLNAMVYGLNRLLNDMLLSGIGANPAVLATLTTLINKLLFNIVKTLAIYRYARNSVFTKSYVPITESDISTEYDKIEKEKMATNPVFGNRIETVKIKHAFIFGTDKLLKDRIKAIEADTGKPLSRDELLRVQTALLSPKVHSILSQDELRALELQAQVQRQKTTGNVAMTAPIGTPILTQQAPLGYPKQSIAVNITPYEERKKEIEDTYKIFSEQLEAYRNYLITHLNNAQHAPTADVRTNALYISDQLVNQALTKMASLYMLENGHSVPQNEIDHMRDNALYTGANGLDITDLLTDTPTFLSTPGNRTIYVNKMKQIIRNLRHTATSIKNLELTQNSEAYEQEKRNVHGSAMPRYHRLGLPAMRMNDERNEMYDY